MDRDQTLPPSAPRVLNGLLKRMSWSKGFTTVSAASIAVDRGTSERTAKRGLEAFVNGGYAMRRLRPGTNPGKRGGQTTYAETTLP